MSDQQCFLDEINSMYHISESERFRQQLEARDDYYRCQLDIQHLLSKQATEIAVKNEQIAAKNEQIAAKNELIATKEELLAAKKKLVATNEELIATQKELLAANEEIVSLKAQLAAK